MWSPLDYPCHDGSVGDNCDPYCLYNIMKDPSEHDNLSEKEPDKLQELLKRYNSYAKGIPLYITELPVYEDACKT